MVASTDELLRSINVESLMARTEGRPEIGIALVDGPVAVDHSGLERARIQPIGAAAACRISDSGSCIHGTFVAGILVAHRSSGAPAIAPGCTLLVRPIFGESTRGDEVSATPRVTAEAIVEAVDAGARVINVSSGPAMPTTVDSAVLQQALNHAAQRGVIVVAAAGNQAAVASSVITRHHGVIPVVGYGNSGSPAAYTNVSASAGRRGVGAPGDSVTSLAAGGGLTTMGGTSFATAFVSGTLALLWSLIPGAHANELRNALATRGSSVVPVMLDAARAYRTLSHNAAEEKSTNS